MVANYNAEIPGSNAAPGFGPQVKPIVVNEPVEAVQEREQGRVSGRLSQLQQEAQQRISEAQQQAQAAISQAQFQAQEQTGERRRAVEALRMQRAQELAALEQRFAAEIEGLAAAGRTSPRVNPRSQVLPLPGVG